MRSFRELLLVSVVVVVVADIVLVTAITKLTVLELWAAAAAVLVVAVVVAIALILVGVMEPNAQSSQHNFKINSSFLLFRTVEIVRESWFIMDLSSLHSIHAGDKEMDCLNWQPEILA